ncbi:hemicentin-1-like [Palaemon carinicauda]|uniref:hemicentin-1-like n=1 Tax=Palaemon carinicauda TaxID=392227 RepID=UPI0035B62A78
MKITFSLLLLVVGNLIHCQDHEKDNDSNLEEVLEELEVISDKLKGYETIQRKQDEIMDKLMELHRDMEHIKGLIQETQQCPRGDELQHSHNVSAADECSEGSHHCGRLGICEDTSFGFTCSCPPGFTWDGSDCAGRRE